MRLGQVIEGNEARARLSTGIAGIWVACKV